MSSRFQTRPPVGAPSVSTITLSTRGSSSAARYASQNAPLPRRRLRSKSSIAPLTFPRTALTSFFCQGFDYLHV